jgi:hypothetical protein
MVAVFLAYVILLAAVVYFQNSPRLQNHNSGMDQERADRRKWMVKCAFVITRVLVPFIVWALTKQQLLSWIQVAHLPVLLGPGGLWKMMAWLGLMAYTMQVKGGIPSPGQCFMDR